MMQEKLWKVMLVYSILFSAAAMSVMLYFSATKTIVIAEEAAPEYADGEKRAGDMPERELRFQEKGAAGGIRIPLPEEIRADDIIIENRYIEHSICIFLTGEYEAFYGSRPVEGKEPGVTGGTIGEEDGITRLQLQLTEPYEQEYVFENGMLHLTLTKPSGLYDKIVVLDPVCGDGKAGAEEKDGQRDITLEVAERVAEELEGSGIHAYCTRTDGREASEEEKLKFADDLQADMAVGIRTAADIYDGNIYGIQAYYNKKYFIPYFGNTELADLLVRCTAAACGGKANGLYEAEEDDALLQYLQIPAAAVEIGYVTNEREAQLLSSDEYREMLAEGIAEAVKEAFAEKEQAY